MKTALKPRFFVVIHTVTPRVFGLDHALEQAAIAKDHGADGIFIIPDYAKGPEMQATTLDQLLYVKILREKLPDFLIGVNFLTQISGLAQGIYAVQPDLLQTDGTSLQGISKEQLPKTEFFCGVAFKYSRNENLTGEQLRQHCLTVANICDVPTTSGRATGHSANIKKIEEIVSSLPHGKRLGLASGVTVENVDAYLHSGVTDFLVATSIVARIDELGRDVLDPFGVAKLSEKIHSYP